MYRSLTVEALYILAWIVCLRILKKFFTFLRILAHEELIVSTLYHDVKNL